MRITHNPIKPLCLKVLFGDDYLSHDSLYAYSSWYSFAPLPLSQYTNFVITIILLIIDYATTNIQINVFNLNNCSFVIQYFQYQLQ